MLVRAGPDRRRKLVAEAGPFPHRLPAAAGRQPHRAVHGRRLLPAASGGPHCGDRCGRHRPPALFLQPGRSLRADDCQARRRPASSQRLDKTHLAYVVTGEQDVDDISERGLDGPHRVPDLSHDARTRRRPSASTSPRTNLSFYPIIYWPISATAPMPSPRRDQPHRRLYARRRHRAVRHARPVHLARRQRRRISPNGRAAAGDPCQSRHSAAGAGSDRPRADQVLLSAVELPRPLYRQPALDRGAAGQSLAADRQTGRARPTAFRRS